MLKFSRQREAIKAFLSTRTDHPTAETVYANIRNDCPNISLGTVYRNLSLLASLGEIMKIHCNDNSDHFDPNTEQHYHFQCQKCNAVSDIPYPMEERLNEVAAQEFDGHIDGHTILFYGTCSGCTES